MGNHPWFSSKLRAVPKGGQNAKKTDAIPALPVVSALGGPLLYNTSRFARSTQLVPGAEPQPPTPTDAPKYPLTGTSHTPATGASPATAVGHPLTAMYSAAPLLAAVHNVPLLKIPCPRSERHFLAVVQDILCWPAFSRVQRRAAFCCRLLFQASAGVAVLA